MATKPEFLVIKDERAKLGFLQRQGLAEILF